MAIARFAAVIAGLGMLATAGAARAEYFETGRDLYKKCRDTGTASQVFCFGFIIGIADVMEDNPLDGRSACIPRDASIQQVAEVVIQFLEANPEIREFTGESLAVQALSERFPCAKPKTLK
jgi:hypothetical protein